MLTHIDKDFTNIVGSRLDDESFLGLDHTTTFLIDDRFAVSVDSTSKHSRQLFWNFATLKHLAKLENLFMRKLLHTWRLRSRVHRRHSIEPIARVHIALTIVEGLVAVDVDTLSCLSKLFLEHLHIF